MPGFPTQKDPNACPLCGGKLNTPPAQATADDDGDTTTLDCRNCGAHRFTFEAARLFKHLQSRPLAQAKVAHAVARTAPGALLTMEHLQNMERVTQLPMAMERIERLVLHIGRKGGPGTTLSLLPEELSATLGADGIAQTSWVLMAAYDMELVRGNRPQTRAGNEPIIRAELTVKGWQLHDELLRKSAGSQHAFMAMPFNDEAKALYSLHLRDAVDHTGFDLRTTDHPGKTAGAIDNRMRVEIRTARFVVCNLTDNNRGAYWEAGFAEGLGQPVFYICRRDQAESRDPASSPHFDIAQQLIIRYDADNPGPAMEELKATIRATLPAEARMQDKPEPKAQRGA